MDALTSIPIRCVVERCVAPENERDNTSNAGPSNTPNSRSPTAAGFASGGQTTSDCSPNTCSSSPESTASSSNTPLVEQDSYAIIPCGVSLHDLVRTALIRLGYSSSEAVGAKGFIQLKNWKQLTIDQISESCEATVGDILGDICPAVVLRIRLNRPRTNVTHELKDKLLQILLAHSYSLLVNSGCPIDQSMLAALCEHGTRGAGKEFDVSEETAKKFDAWYLQQVFNHYRRIATLAAAQADHQQAVAAVAVAAAATQQQLPPSRGSNIHPLLSSVVGEFEHHSQLSQSNPPTQLHDQLNSTASPQQEQQHFVRTRIRTSFDPELELPKLHKWFAENQHPSRAQIQQYVKELNALDSRKGRKLLDVNNVVYWFKNARAAHKRQELKFVNGSHSPPADNNGGNQFSVNSTQEMSDTKNLRDGSESSGKHSQEENGHNEDGEDSGDHEYSGAEGIDDDSSQMSQTLDLSVRPLKRRKSESLSPCSQSGHEINRYNNFAIKEEQTDDEDDLNDIDDHDYFSENIPSGNDTAFSGSTPNGNRFYSNNGNSLLPQPDSPEEGRRIRRSRTFIDPMTEVPRLEQWFAVNTHPTHSQIVKYTEELNNLPYRQKFPKLEPKNIQFWFKNRRAKYKRLSLPSQIHQPTLALTCGPPVTSTSLTSVPSSQSNASSYVMANNNNNSNNTSPQLND